MTSSLDLEISSVDGVILAAGGGTRMRPLSLTTPKPMLPICNKPLLAVLAENMVKIGIKLIVIVVSPLNKNFVSKYFENNPLSDDVSIKYAIQEKPLGTAHALSQAESYVENDCVFVLAGDNFLLSQPMKNLVNAHFSNNPKVTIALKEVSEKEISSLSSVLLNQEGFIEKIIEKPRKSEILSLLAATSALVVEKDIFDILKKIPRSKRGEYEIPTAFEFLLQNNQLIKGLKMPSWDHISTPSDLWRFNIIECRKEITSPSLVIPSSSVVKDCIIGLGSKIGSNSKLKNCLLLPKTIIPKNFDMKNAVLYTNNNSELEIHQIPDDYLQKHKIKIKD
jgi:NDP-sugar pyrophosphorylase family protein